MPPIKHFIAVLYDRTAVHFEPEYSPGSPVKYIMLLDTPRAGLGTYNVPEVEENLSFRKLQ